MNDKFDLKGYLGSKRLLNENFESQPLNEDNDLISYNELIELARKAGKTVIDARDALIELAINRGGKDGVSKQAIEDVLAEYDISMEDLEDNQNDDEPIDNSDDEDLEPESLDEADNSSVRINTKDTSKVTGTVPDEEKGKWFPKPKDAYILEPKQLEILKKWTPSVKSHGGRAESPGCKMVNGQLYILVSMIPELEGKRGRGGKYSVRDDIKASMKSSPADAMGLLKAIDYAIKNSTENSVKLPGSTKDDKTGENIKFEYKRIAGKAVENGYEIQAAPKKELEETTNINENTMTDNFDLRAYLGSKRLLTENFEPMEDDEINDDEYYKGDEEDVELDDTANLDDYEIPETFAWEDDYLEEAEPNINNILGKNSSMYKSLSNKYGKNTQDDPQVTWDDFISEEKDEDADEEIDDSKWYNDEDDEELSDDTNLDDFEMPETFAWEDDYLEEADIDENSPQWSPSTSPTTTPTVKPGEKTRRRTLTPPDDAPTTGPKASLEEVDEKELVDKIGERFNQLKQDKAVNERMQTLAGLK